MKIRKEFKFYLPTVISDETGRKEKISGVMRLVKVKDLIDVFRDMRVKKNPAYFYVVVLSRVVMTLGKNRMVNSKVIEALSPENFAFLVDLFNEINHRIIAQIPVECSQCSTKFLGEINLMGEI